MLGFKLMTELKQNAEQKVITTHDGQCIAYEEYFGWKAKTSIDAVDCLFTKLYGFNDELLDFIVNYYIKYRMGQSSGEEDTDA